MPVRSLFFPIGPSICYVTLTRGAFAVIDVEDASSIGLHNWSLLRTRSGNQYAVTNRKQPNQRFKTVQMHQLLFTPESGCLTDHSNNCGLHNFRANLRSATPSQNAQNQRTRADSKLSIKGVRFVARLGKYQARIRISGSLKSLGCRSTIEEAKALYDAAAAIHFGEFARFS